MSLRNSKPLRFSPAGVSDALAEEDAFPGACTDLTNLIPDPSTKNLWTPRPASVLITNFSGFTTPTGVVVFKVVGNLVYGMVSSAHFSGKDEPFVYNLATSAFVTLTGVTSGACPTTQSTSGEWTPPTMDVMGVYVVVTHPGWDGVTNFIGWFDATNPAAPIWNAGNFALVTPLTTVRITNGGTGYTNGTYNMVPLLGGTGAGAQATIVVAGNVVTTVTVTKGGLGYKVGDVLTAANSILGSAGNGFSATASGVTGSGVLLVNITGAGTGYTNGSYTNIAMIGGFGAGATLNINVSATTVNSAVVNTPGGGYLVGDTLVPAGAAVLTFNNLVGGSGYTNGTFTNVVLNGGSGVLCTANITVSGTAVTVCTVNNGGAEYKVGDTLSAGGGGIGTIGGLPVSVVGSGIADGMYSNVPILSTSGSGSGTATFIVTVSGGFVTDITVGNPGTGFAPGDTFVVGPFGGSAAGGFTVLSVVNAGPLSTGTGFTVDVHTISAIPIGNGGSGFNVQVASVTNPGGFINFTTIPSWVRQFNGRSWFGINPTVGQPSIIFSDVFALNATNATQALSFGDNSVLTAAAPLPLSNLLGGVIQSLIVFKAYTGIIQITGDATTNNLSVNDVPGGSGTESPRSVVTHPQGLLYLDHDGYRMVTMDGTCTDPIGASGAGVSVPLLNPVARSRVNAACNGSVLRVSLQNSILGGAPWQEYWFDLTRKNWSGPHTFPSIMIDAYAQNFIIAAQSAPANLFNGAIQPFSGNTFTENGSALTWTYQTVVLMDNQAMAQSEIAEMQVKITPAAATTAVVTIIDQNGTTIATTTYTFGAVTGLAAHLISFSAPVVYNRMAVKITGASVSGLQIGDIYVRERILGYIQAIA